MPIGFYISAEGANAQLRRLDTIANNMANVETVGFKKDYAVFQARYAEGVQEGLVTPWMGQIEDEGGGVKTQATATDFAQGRLKRTGRQLDMAIQGDGFFAVRKGEKTCLTRAGNFDINGFGELTTPEGYPVLNTAGTPIAIDPEGGPWSLLPDGTLTQGAERHELALWNPDSLDQMVKLGENLFEPLGQTSPVPTEKRHVADSYLEMSGVEATTEMVDMITTSRYFEANTRLMQTQDEMLSGLVNRAMRVR